jgi:hypothetical protein
MHNEIIEAIKEIDKDEEGFAGFHIITSDQEIQLLIYNESECCESWGYFFCNDDFNEFIGSKLYRVKLTDKALNTKILDKNIVLNSDHDEPNLMFVDIETNKGSLQFVAYNSQNGYYGHDAIIKSRFLDHRETL